jgi:cytoskeleton protein RodZ
MIEIGRSLVAAREARGLSLADAEQITHLRVRYLAALEADDVDALPGRAYARAFLRTYATALGLEADQLVDEFERRIPEPQGEGVPAVQGPQRSRRKGAVVVLLVGSLALLAALALGLAVWLGGSPVRTAKPRQPALPAKSPRPQPAAAPVKHRSKPDVLIIRAVRGDCWLLVRRGGAGGQLLYEETLHRGSAVSFRAPRVWVRFGAPGMVDVTRGGRTVGGLSGLTPLNRSV